MKRLLFICGLVYASAAQAQTPVGLSPIPRPTFTQNGAPLLNGCLFSFAAGTSTPLATFTDSSGTVQNSNPILLDANGTANSGGNEVGIYLSAAAYKFQLKTAGGSSCSTGSTVWTADNVSATAFLNIPNTWTALQTFSAGIIVTGPLTATGTTTLKNLNNIQFCDQFAGADASAKIQACINALPSVGGIADARNLTDAGGTGSSTIDPASRAVTLLLGPTTYFISQIVFRSGFHIYGINSGVGVGGTPPATILQSSGTVTAMFVLGGTTAVLGTHVESLRVYCGATNVAQIGFNIVAPNGGGHWWSDYKDVFVGGDGIHECAGGPFLYDGNAGGAAGTAINQWIAFRDVRAFRTTNGAPALKITGLNGQFSADNSEFDGPIPRDNNKVNILINDGTETFRSPYNFAFSNVTSQLAWGATGVAIQLAGVSDFTCLNCHFENDNGGIKATIGNTYGSWGTLIKDSQFDTGTGINGGTGFILSTDANASISFEDNSVSGTPDTMFAGTSTKYVSSKGNINFTSGILQPAPANNRPIGGFDGDGPALKHKRVTTGSVGAGTRINTTVTWTTAFPDANYTPVCTVIDSTTAPTAAGLVFERLNTIQTAASVTATISNPTGGAITGQLDCIAIHD